MNIQRIFSEDNITTKFGIPLQINKSYILNVDIGQIKRILVVYKGVYICQQTYEYYFIFQLLDLYGYYRDENLINEDLKLKILTNENIDFIKNNVENNILNGRLIRNEKKQCFQQQTNNLRDWIYQQPYFCISVKVGGQGNILHLNEQTAIYIGDVTEYKILEDNYIYPLPKHILSYQESIDTKVVHAQCNQVNREGKYYFIEFEGNNYNNLINEIPIIVNPNELEDGFYTYVILSIGSSEPNLYLFKINSIFELGTKHPELVEKIARINNEDINTFHIYYAGEIKVDNTKNQILFNFNSGGFMYNLISVRDLVEGKPLVIGKLRMILNPKYNIKYYNNTLIDARYIEFTQEELDKFNRMGAIIQEFEDGYDCNDYMREYYENKYRGGTKIMIIKQVRKNRRKKYSKTKKNNKSKNKKYNRKYNRSKSKKYNRR
jgi:hypothetical protein